MSALNIFSDIFRSFVPSFERSAFHGDRVYQSLVKTLIQEIPISTFIETGTFLGNSAGFVAQCFPGIVVRTCELNEEFLGRAKRRLWRLKNIEFYLDSSEKFIRKQVQSLSPDSHPLFFLDSHWYEYWPLQDELLAIAESGLSCVIVIDDFQIPNHSDFGFDVDRKSNLACGMDMIIPILATYPQNRYQFVLPQYTRKDAFGQNERGQLRGHVVVFQNMMVTATLHSQLEKYYEIK